MASTSVSSVQRSFKYDVFLSFRGEDTRKNIVGHLCEALKQKGIETYKDNERIEKGERIDNQLLESIDDSRFCIIVFSKNYATSSWCLDELVKIMECQKTTEQTAFTVYYDVEPTEVRNQSGSVGEAFCKHETNEAAVKWRKAMKEAAVLAGWVLKETANGDESKLIQKVVAHIFIKLISIKSSVDGNLVGMARRIEDVLSSLEIDTEDVRLIGIKGIGGAGKTTLATTLFNQISNNFEGASFVNNVREKTSLSGLKELQKKILTDVFGYQKITINSSGGENTMKQMMHRKKALIVLDDVDNIDQLEALAGDPNWFKLGSRIIITTRDLQVLKSHRVKFIHDVNLLLDKEDICLLSRHAFGEDIPTIGYEELAKEVVNYASGLPLTIKVLGSSLYANDKAYWISTLKRLKEIPLKATMEILELSYNCLEKDYKEIFLDVACLLKGSKKDKAIIALESCGFFAINGLRILEQKSLITVSKYGTLVMHDHLEEMGRNIVRRLHSNSRLWIREEIKDILTLDMGTQVLIKCIKLTTKEYDPQVLIKGLRNMKELRFLHVDSFATSHPNEDSLYLPNSLQYLEWHHYPFQSLPKTFQANNLVGLVMDASNMVQLLEDGEEKILNKLRFLDIKSSYLITLDLSIAPSLEKLSLFNCDLEELQIPTGSLKLTSIKVSNMNKLRILDIRIAPNLEELIIDHVDGLVELHMPAESLKLRYLRLDQSKLKNLDLTIAPNLEELIIDHADGLVELHMPAESLKLRYLRLDQSKLKNLDLTIAPNLEELTLLGCDHLVKLPMLTKCLQLIYLKISHSKLMTLDLGLTPNLERLYLEECHDLVEVNAPVGCLSKIVNLELTTCGLFKSFIFDRALHSLEVGSLCELKLIAYPIRIYCGYKEDPSASSFGYLETLISVGLCASTNLGRFCESICGLQHLRKLTLQGSFAELPRDLNQLEYLEELILSSTKITILPPSLRMLKHLKSVEVT